MAYQQTTALRSQVSLLRLVLNVIRHGVLALLLANRRRRSLRALEALDERLLKDVGLQRTVSGYQVDLQRDVSRVRRWQ
ncbi:DUF1127 domain-containing protein [Roseibium limicola]|uniref:DUF1127 domain-containing protein n=1 Tax=Roseibium limicola TaxID=2816037 RepID=A0A939EPH5_9HYPH|nr:DUF1127 domain-containing protein [Roseibium limicola]MBO0345571.1 DUF1127 domain-containing protein [Roseibium limicola]